MSNPNKPELNQQFNSKAKDEPLKTNELKPEKPSTKYELEKLEAQRQQPKPTLDLAPSGGISNTNKENKALKDREERIKIIKERMALSKEKLRTNWDKSKG